MLLSEMQTRAWVMIGDDPSSPVKLTAANALLYINQAIQDVADLTMKRTSATLTFVAGIATLPSDYWKIIRIEDLATGATTATKLTPIFTLEDAVLSTDTTSQYILLGTTQVQIFGATPSGTVTIYYYPLPTALSGASDTPSEIPARCHHWIPEVYVPALYRLSQGDANTYAALMEIWENQAKTDIQKALNLLEHEDETPETIQGVW